MERICDLKVKVTGKENVTVITDPFNTAECNICLQLSTTPKCQSNRLAVHLFVYFLVAIKNDNTRSNSCRTKFLR